LDEILKNTNIAYTVKDRQILLSSKSSQDNFIENNQQQKSISGKVTDSSGVPLPGVTIVIKGTTTGTITDSDGNYSLSNFPGDATLVFSFVGMKSQEIMIAGKSTMNVKMLEETIGLEEVVAVGYGTMKKSDVTGALTSLSEDEIKSIPVVNPALAIQGRAAGVQVMNNSHQPGGNVSISIRGTNSINANNDPLYVVDGFPLTGGLEFINPNDIVSMEILKDASATAIYGSRGANGVVLISTKKGKEGKMSVSFNTSSKISLLSKKIKMLNASGFRMLMNEAYANQNMLDGGNRDLPYTQEEIDNPEYDIDWQDEATRTAFSHNHNLDISGGNDKLLYAASIAYKNEEGIIKTSDWNQLSTRVNLEAQLSKKIRFGINLNYNNVDNGLVETDHGGNSIPRAMLETMPDIPIYDEDENWTIGTNEGYASPTALIEGIHNKKVTDKLLGNLFATIELAKGLTFKTTYGREIQNSKQDKYTNSNLISQAHTSGSAYVYNNKIASWQNENYLTYNKTFGEHQLTGLVGLTWSKYSNEYFDVTVKDFPTDAFLTNQLQAGEDITSANSSKEDSKLNSYFGRINYTYKSKYLFTGTLRTDGSSKFGENNKYAFFPSLAFGWRLSEEDFIKDLNTFSNLKLRLGYGITGNQEIDNYQSLERLGSVTAILGNDRASGIAETQIANPDLKWEKTEQFNVGLDFGVLDNRLSFVVDYYDKTTKDLLLESPIPSTTGFSTMMKNIGSVSNKGFELTMNTVNFNGKFKWFTNMNVSFNKNKVLELANGGQDLFPVTFVNPLIIIREGEPLGSFWGLTREGIYQNEEEISEHLRNPGTTVPGDIKYKDLYNDGVIDSNDRSILGDNNPDFIYGFTNDFVYGPWSLSVQISGVQGMEVMNLNPIVLEDRQTLTNSYKTLLNRWHGEGTGNNEVAMVRISSQLNISDRHVEDGSYLRFKNISLGYELPQKFTNIFKIDSAKLTFSLIDWFTITNYSGYDPEVSTYGGHASQGIEFSSYPNSKSALMSLNINF
jgi:TonB-linked SusC/RagA family outer membrane protein